MKPARRDPWSFASAAFRGRAASGILGAGALLLPLTVAACPLCDSETGRQVRAGIFGDDFWSTLAAVLLPFPILLGVLAVMHFGLPRLPKPRAPRPESPAP